MGYIYGFITCTRVMWEQDEDGNTFEDPVEEHGWVDRRWNPRTLYDNRNDVSPVVKCDEECVEDLADEVRDALDWLEGGYEDYGNGTFYSKESYKPFDEEWHYSYAIHFTRKLLTSNGWAEERWHPEGNGGIGL